MRKLLRLSWMLAGSLATPLFASETDLSWLDQRIQELQPKPHEKRFDEIGWAKDIRQAERLAAENHRPIFLFTHDGRMNLGRC